MKLYQRNLQLLQITEMSGYKRYSNMSMNKLYEKFIYNLIYMVCILKDLINFDNFKQN